MPTKTTLRSHKFFNQFLNDESFSSNLSEFTENLAGNEIELLKVVSELEITWEAKSSSAVEWDFERSGNDISIQRSSGNFFTDGFWVGSVCDIRRNVGSNIIFQIDFISNDGRTIEGTRQNTNNIPNGSYDDMILRPIAADSSNALTALEYGFGIIGEQEPYNNLSKVSNNPQKYYFTALNALPTNGQVKGQYNDFVSGSMECIKQSDPDTFTQRYEISHIFRVNPFYLDGDLSNLQNGVVPDLFNNDSLKYAFDVDFRITNSNPNKSVKATFDNVLGSVGWFGENFNGFDNNYNIVSIAYEDVATTDSVDGLQISSRTKVTVEVEKINGVFNPSQRHGFFVSYLAPQNEYQNTVTTQDENFLLDSLFHNSGSGVLFGTGIIKSLDSNILGSGNLQIVAETEYLIDQQLRLSTDSSFLISIQLADNTLSSGNSDRVQLYSTGQYQKSGLIEGLASVSKFNYLVYGEQLGIDSGAITVDEAWNEDAILIDGEFELDLVKFDQIR